MTLREANIDDRDRIRDLFLDTITSVNTKDYNKDQIRIWSSGYNDLKQWNKKLKEQFFLIAEIDGDIAGFASLAIDGYLDFLYVHKDHQRKGVATTLLKGLEEKADQEGLKLIASDVSITARPFFEQHGFKVTQEQRRKYEGVEILNYKMVKDRSSD